MTYIPSVRCVVLKNHKNREAQYRIAHSMSPHFVRLRCSNWQAAVGMHHQLAIDHVKFMLGEDGHDPNDFDFVSFDYLEGYFIDHLFKGKQALDIWDKCDIIDIRHLGPEVPEDGDSDEAEDADHFPDSEFSKSKLGQLDQSDNKKEGYFTNDG